MRLLWICLIFLMTWSIHCFANKAIPPIYLNQLKAPPGFKITVFARLPYVRQLNVAEDGMIYTGSSHHQGNNAVYAIKPTADYQHADKMYKLIEGLDAPIGVAYYKEDLYIGEQFQIRKLPKITGNWTKPSKRVVVVLDKVPLPQPNFSHSRKYIKFGPDGRLYFQVGDPVDSSQSDNPIIHTILSIRPDGTDMQIYARGIRNTVGFDWQPNSNVLWFTDNGQDHLGDAFPPDEINRADRQGMDFGFPCYIGNNIRVTKYQNCPPVNTVTPPAAELEAHAAPLGLTFNRGTQFPSEYANNMFVAQHGSSIRRDKKVGYNVLRVVIEDNKVVKVEPFITGWLQGSEFWGRPVDVAQLPDGSLLIADDYSGTIYRVSYVGIAKQ